MRTRDPRRPTTLDDLVEQELLREQLERQAHARIATAQRTIKGIRPLPSPDQLFSGEPES